MKLLDYLWDLSHFPKNKVNIVYITKQMSGNSHFITKLSQEMQENSGGHPGKMQLKVSSTSFEVAYTKAKIWH